MSNKTVKVVIPETHPVLMQTLKEALAIVHSNNALTADQSQIHSFGNFSSALAHINHEVEIEIKLTTGKIISVRHVFREPSDLEANANVNSKKLKNAGMLYKVLETREMLLKKAIYSDISNALKKEKKSKDLNLLLKHENKTELVKRLRAKATEYKQFANTLQQNI